MMQEIHYQVYENVFPYKLVYKYSKQYYTQWPKNNPNVQHNEVYLYNGISVNDNKK